MMAKKNYSRLPLFPDTFAGVHLCRLPQYPHDVAKFKFIKQRVSIDDAGRLSMEQLPCSMCVQIPKN